MSPLPNVVLGKELRTKVWTASLSSFIKGYYNDYNNMSGFQRQQSLGSNDGSLTSLLGNIWPVTVPLCASFLSSVKETIITVLTEYCCPDN